VDLARVWLLHHIIPPPSEHCKSEIILCLAMDLFVIRKHAKYFFNKLVCYTKNKQEIRIVLTGHNQVTLLLVSL
jgi:hypothetical protein